MIRKLLVIASTDSIWCCAWSNKKIGIWEDFGPVGLKFLEYLLIGVAGTVFPNHLLNSEGN